MCVKECDKLLVWTRAHLDTHTQHTYWWRRHSRQIRCKAGMVRQSESERETSDWCCYFGCIKLWWNNRIKWRKKGVRRPSSIHKYASIHHTLDERLSNCSKKKAYQLLLSSMPVRMPPTKNKHNLNANCVKNASFGLKSFPSAFFLRFFFVTSVCALRSVEPIFDPCHSIVMHTGWAIHWNK